MSLFRTLQHSPATISIFHNAKVPASASLYKILDKSYWKLNEEKSQFQVDLMANQMPTYDQFNLIYHQCLHNQTHKDILRDCFPFMRDQRLSTNKNSSITVTSPIGLLANAKGGSGNLKVFLEGEYSMIYEAFNSLVNDPTPDVNPANLFLAPLVVDWDQNLIANNEESLSVILNKYKADVADAGLSPA